MKLFSNEEHNVSRAGNLFKFKVGKATEVLPEEYAEALLNSYPKKYAKEVLEGAVIEEVKENLHEEETISDAPPFTQEDLEKFAEDDLAGMYAEKFGKAAPKNITKTKLITRIME